MSAPLIERFIYNRGVWPSSMPVVRRDLGMPKSTIEAHLRSLQKAGTIVELHLNALRYRSYLHHAHFPEALRSGNPDLIRKDV